MADQDNNSQVYQQEIDDLRQQLTAKDEELAQLREQLQQALSVQPVSEERAQQLIRGYLSQIKVKGGGDISAGGSWPNYTVSTRGGNL